MAAYPVHFSISKAQYFSRVQLLVRFVAFIALGILGLSFASVFMFCFVALPVYAASRLGAQAGVQGYIEQDGPRVIRFLQWFAALSSWAGLTSEQLPSKTPDEIVLLQIEQGVHGQPTVASSIGRVVFGLPSAFVLMILGFVGAFVWWWAMFSILFTERVSPGAFNYLVGLQRWSVRLLAYQASLVDAYPPFSFSDAPQYSSEANNP